MELICNPLGTENRRLTGSFMVPHRGANCVTKHPAVLPMLYRRPVG